MRFTFYNWPTEYNIDDYSRAQNTFLQRHIPFNPDAIFKIGNPKPKYGLSDLDFIIVPTMNSEQIPPYSRWSNNLDASTKYILCHAPIIMPKHILNNIHYLLHFTDINKIYGQNIKIRKKSNKDDLINLLNIINLYYPREFLKYLLTKKINVKSLLGSLNRFTYVLQLYQKITGYKDDEQKEFITNVQNLRNTWFTQEVSKEQLIMHLDQAIILVLKLIQKLLMYLDEIKLWNTQKIPCTYYVTPTQSLLFRQEWTPKKALIQSKQLFNKFRIIASILPCQLFPFFWQTSIPDIQKLINMSIYRKPSISIEHDFKNYLVNRQKIIDSQLYNYYQYGEDCMNLGTGFAHGLLDLSYKYKMKMFLKQYLLRQSL